MTKVLVSPLFLECPPSPSDLYSSSKMQDGTLNDTELNEFQVQCFSAPLQPEELAGVKKVVAQKMPQVSQIIHPSASDEATYYSLCRSVAARMQTPGQSVAKLQCWKAFSACCARFMDSAAPANKFRNLHDNYQQTLLKVQIPVGSHLRPAPFTESCMQTL